MKAVPSDRTIRIVPPPEVSNKDQIKYLAQNYTPSKHGINLITATQTKSRGVVLRLLTEADSEKLRKVKP